MAEFVLDPTEQDYVAASRAAYLAHLRTWRGGLRLIVLVVAVVAVSVVANMLIDGSPGSFPLFMVAFAIAGVPLGVAVNLLWLPRKVRRMFAQQPAYAEPMSYRWSEDGFALRSAISTIDLRWPQLFRWVEARAVFLLYLTEYQSVFVPKRGLSPADAEALRRLLIAASERRGTIEGRPATP